MFSSTFICLLAGLHKNYSADFHEKILLDFGGNPDHATLRLELG